MPTTKPDGSGPVVEISLGLAAWLQPLAAREHALHLPVCQAAAGGLNRLLAELVIPGEAHFTLASSEMADSRGMWGTVTIGDETCTPSEDPARRVAASLGKPGLVNADELRAWLEPDVSQPPEKAQVLVEFLVNACLEMVNAQPDLLMGPQHAVWITKKLPTPPRRKGITLPHWPPDPEWLLPVLRQVVGLGIPLTDRAALSQAAAEALLGKEASEDLAERLAGNLAPRVIGILLPEQRFKELTLEWQSAGPGAFGGLRRRLARSFGFNLPPFRLEAVQGLGQDEFVIRVNALSSRGRGLEDNLFAVLEGELRRQLPRLVILPRVEEQLELLDAELREMVAERLELPRLTRLLRAAARQDGSLRRLPVLLEYLLDYPFYQAGASGSLALTGRLLPAPPDTPDEFEAQLAFLKSAL